MAGLKNEQEAKTGYNGSMFHGTILATPASPPPGPMSVDPNANMSVDPNAGANMSVAPATPVATPVEKPAPKKHQNHSHALAVKALVNTGRLDAHEAREFIKDIKEELTRAGHHLIDGGPKTEALIAKTALKKIEHPETGQLHNTGQALNAILDAMKELANLVLPAIAAPALHEHGPAVMADKAPPPQKAAPRLNIV